MQRHIEAEKARAEWMHSDSECLEITQYARPSTIPGQAPEIFTVAPPPEKLIGVNGRHGLRNWLGRKSPGCAEYEPIQLPDCECRGMFRLLIQRKRSKRDIERYVKPIPFSHVKRGQSHELGPMTPLPPPILPWESPEIYELVRQALHLPRTYIPALNHLSGIVELSNVPGPNGRELIGFIAQNTNYRWESWSLALTYDPTTNITTGFFCADAEASNVGDKTIDIDGIIDDLTHQNSPSIHPMYLPTIMLSQLHDSSVDHYNTLHAEIWNLEGDIGKAKCKGSIEDKDCDHHSWSMALNMCRKQQASRDGRYHFWHQFHRELLRAMKRIESHIGESFQEYSISEEQYKRYMTGSHDDLQQWISFTALKFESFEGRDVNSRGRVEAQLKRLYNLITQNESRSQVYLTRAMSKDSTAMKFCAMLGALFCPATFVATMFSIQEYDKLTASNFRIYMRYASPIIAFFALLALIFPMKWFWSSWCERKELAKAANEGDDACFLESEEIYHKNDRKCRLSSIWSNHSSQHQVQA